MQGDKNQPKSFHCSNNHCHFDFPRHMKLQLLQSKILHSRLLCISCPNVFIFGFLHTCFLLHRPFAVDDSGLFDNIFLIVAEIQGLLPKDWK